MDTPGTQDFVAHGDKDSSHSAEESGISYTAPTTATDDARDSSLPYPNTPLNVVFPSASAVSGGSPHTRTPPRSSPEIQPSQSPNCDQPTRDEKSDQDIQLDERTPLLDPGMGEPGINRSINDGGVAHPSDETKAEHVIPNTPPRSQGSVGEQGPVTYSCWPQFKGKLIQYQRWIYLAIVAIIIVSVISVITGPVFKLHKTYSTNITILPGSVALLFSGDLFWHNKVSVSEKRQEDGSKVEADIYVEYGNDCDSNEPPNNITYTTRILPFTEPSPIDELKNLYLLYGSMLVINVTVYPESEYTYPPKVCQFTSSNYYDALLDAKSVRELEEAESKGYCQALSKPSQNATTTSLKFRIDSHGYYYYALSIFVNAETNDTVTLSYTYLLQQRYYNGSKFTPLQCSVVDDNECTKSGLTTRLGKFCILALITDYPSLAEDQPPSYTFITELSQPYGILIFVLPIDVIIFCIGILCVMICCWSHIHTLCSKCKRTCRRNRTLQT